MNQFEVYVHLKHKVRRLGEGDTPGQQLHSKNNKERSEERVSKHGRNLHSLTLLCADTGELERAYRFGLRYEWGTTDTSELECAYRFGLWGEYACALTR